MQRWLILTVFLAGLTLGISGTIMAPRLIHRYVPDRFLPEALQSKQVLVDGTVVAKQREQDRLLLTVHTAEGAVLATFTQKVPEIDLLVQQGDTLSLYLRRYEPFVMDPTIGRVKKPQPFGRLEGREPPPSPPVAPPRPAQKAVPKEAAPAKETVSPKETAPSKETAPPKETPPPKETAPR